MLVWAIALLVLSGAVIAASVSVATVVRVIIVLLAAVVEIIILVKYIHNIVHEVRTEPIL